MRPLLKVICIDMVGSSTLFNELQKNPQKTNIHVKNKPKTTHKFIFKIQYQDGE